MVAINFIFGAFSWRFQNLYPPEYICLSTKNMLKQNNKEIINTLFDQIGLQAAEISVMIDYVILVMELSKLYVIYFRCFAF